MKLSDFGDGVYGHGQIEPLNAYTLEYDYGDGTTPAVGTECAVTITDIMIRRAGVSAYYIVKYRYNGANRRKDGMKFFSVQHNGRRITLKKYLKINHIEL